MVARNQPAQRCRLCNGEVLPRFSLAVLEKHKVDYWECAECHSLQTETPYWLSDAYGTSNLASLDTGAAQRNIHNLAACYFVSILFDVRNAIDIGGGDGLLCRMLRDFGINCYVKDKYATPTYAQGFTEQDFDAPDLVTGFEILEHFPNPSRDLDDVFKYDSPVVLLSTAIYKGEHADWWYLSPESGQHVFFYSRQALDWMAGRYGYELIVSGGFILFTRNASLVRKVAAKLLLSRLVCRLLRAFAVVLPATGVWKDHELQVKRHRQDPVRT